MAEPIFLVELATLAGAPAGQPLAHGIKLNRKLNGGNVLTFEVDNDDQAAPEVRIGDRVARLWQEGSLRFQGKLREPQVRSAGKINSTAGSPFTLLDRRRVQTETSFAAVDQVAIIQQLLAAQDTRGTTRVRVPNVAVSKLRDRTYEAGKSLMDLITEMSGVLEGPWFVENAVLDSSLIVYSELAFRFPNSGTNRPGVRFEYGEGTLGNLLDYQLTESLPVNFVTGVGAAPVDSEGAPTGPVPVERVSDAASIAEYDLLEDWFDDPDVSINSTLVEKAKAILQPEPSFTITFSTVDAGPTINGPPVPELFVDFDVGDVVSCSIRDHATQIFDLRLRVTEATMTINDDDEAVSLELVLESPTGDTWQDAS